MEYLPFHSHLDLEPNVFHMQFGMRPIWVKKDRERKCYSQTYFWDVSFSRGTYWKKKLFRPLSQWSINLDRAALAVLGKLAVSFLHNFSRGMCLCRQRQMFAFFRVRLKDRNEAMTRSDGILKFVRLFISTWMIFPYPRQTHHFILSDYGYEKWTAWKSVKVQRALW